MITNDRQRDLARARLHSFAAAIGANDARAPSPGVDPRLHRALRDAAASEAAELRRQLQHYDDLLAGRVRSGFAAGERDLPAVLVEARLAGGWTQRELANRLGVDEAQVDRWETDDYDRAPPEVLRRASDLFGVRVGEPAEYLPAGPVPAKLRENLSKADVPDDLLDRLEDVDEADRLGVASRGFDWNVDELIFGVPSSSEPRVPVLFKSAKTQKPRRSPLVRLAHITARIAASMATRPPGPRPPADAAELREAVAGPDGQVTLPSLLAWSWNQGFPVLPLVGKGGFAASIWNVDDRPVAVLKRKQAEAAYWLFDLAHELAHVACGHLDSVGLVDVGAPLAQTEDPQEREANDWALSLLMPDHARLIAEIRGDIGSRPAHKEFKFAVGRVAERARMSAGLLGLVAAYEMTDVAESKDRWGSATNLARLEGFARPIVEGEVRKRLPLGSLSRIDRQLMEAVLFSDDDAPQPSETPTATAA